MEHIRRKLMQQNATQFIGIEPASSAHVEVVVAQSETPSHRSGSPQAVSSKDWTLDDLLGKGPRFKAVTRVSALSEQEMLEAIGKHEVSGEPLIIEDWHRHPDWPSDMFSMRWLLEKKGDEIWRVRDVRNHMDIDMTLVEFVSHSRNKTSSDSLLYGKDAECPEEWRQWVNSSTVLPPVVCPNGSNDLLKNLTTSEGVESLMCYLGVGDTFTPCHKDLCASSGQNIMCYTEDGGSSFWFMTASTEAPRAGEYFQSHIGLELDWEDHVATIDEFAQADFTVYVAEQKLGDLVLVPPRSCHQVVNHGGLTLKTSWSRMTIPGLKAALHHELPIYRRVCRQEQYRIKYIICRSLLQFTKDLRSCSTKALSSGETVFLSSRQDPRGSLASTQLIKSTRDLIELMDYILYDEFTPKHTLLPTVLSHDQETTSDIPETITLRSPTRRETKSCRMAKPVHAADSTCNFACDFCGADIFQGFFECNDCTPERDDDVMNDGADGAKDGIVDDLGNGLILCPGCYAEGRTCKCGEMHAAQCRPFGTLLDWRNNAVDTLRAVSTVKVDQYRKALSEEDIKNSDNIKMFYAACTLLAMRESAGQKVNSTRVCSRCKNRKSHQVPYMHGLFCDLCHASMCFTKILKLGLHSADALLTYNEDKGEWHTKHKDSPGEFNRGRSTVWNAERSGAITIYRDRLVTVAMKYTSCRPICPRSVCAGWYDQVSDENGRACLEAPSGTLDTGFSGPDIATLEVAQDIQPESLDDGGQLLSTVLEKSTGLASPQTDARNVPYSVLEGTFTMRSVAAMEDTASDVSTLTPLSSPEQIRAPLAPTPAKRKRMQVYVDVPLRSGKKRSCLASVDEHEAAPHKKIKALKSMLPRQTNDEASAADLQDERRIEEDYGSNLADVINHGNAITRRSTAAKKQPSLKGHGPVAPAPRSVVVVDNDDDDDDLPLTLRKPNFSSRQRSGPSRPLCASLRPASPTSNDTVVVSPPSAPPRSRHDDSDDTRVQTPSSNSVSIPLPVVLSTPAQTHTSPTPIASEKTTLCGSHIHPVFAPNDASVTNAVSAANVVVRRVSVAVVPDKTPTEKQGQTLRAQKRTGMKSGEPSFDSGPAGSSDCSQPIRDKPVKSFFHSADTLSPTREELAEVQMTIRDLIDKVQTQERKIDKHKIALEKLQAENKHLREVVASIPNAVQAEVRKELEGLGPRLQMEVVNRCLETAKQVCNAMTNASDAPSMPPCPLPRRPHHSILSGSQIPPTGPQFLQRHLGPSEQYARNGHNFDQFHSPPGNLTGKEQGRWTQRSHPAQGVRRDRQFQDYPPGRFPSDRRNSAPRPPFNERSYPNSRPYVHQGNHALGYVRRPDPSDAAPEPRPAFHGGHNSYRHPERSPHSPRYSSRVRESRFDQFPPHGGRDHCPDPSERRTRSRSPRRHPYGGRTERAPSSASASAGDHRPTLSPSLSLSTRSSSQDTRLSQGAAEAPNATRSVQPAEDVHAHSQIEHGETVRRTDDSNGHAIISQPNTTEDADKVPQDSRNLPPPSRDSPSRQPSTMWEDDYDQEQQEAPTISKLSTTTTTTSITAAPRG